MTFPAYAALGREIAKNIQHGFTRWKVYMVLQPPLLGFVKPIDIKVEWVMHEASVGRRHATDALTWLTLRGYLVEHGRDARGIRSLTLAWDVGPAADVFPTGTRSPAA